MAQIHVVIPTNLRVLAKIPSSEIVVEAKEPVTHASVLDAVEEKYPALTGTIRDHVTKERRAFIRFFVCSEDVSHESPDTPVPTEVTSGKEPFYVIGAIAGG